MDERDTVRQQILDRLKRVPDWVNSASVQSVRDFMKTHAAAKKTAGRANITLAALHALRNQLNGLYGCN